MITLLSAEQNLLGACLLENSALAEVVDKLTPSDFEKTPHRLIWGAMLECFRLGEKAGIVAVSEVLAESGDLDAAGGRSYVNELAMSVVTTGNVAYLGKVVKSHAIARELEEFALELQGAVQEKTNGVECLNFAQKRVFEIASSQREDRQKDTKELKLQTIENIGRVAESGMNGVSTGLRALDDILRGLSKSDLIILAARPAMGKSALAVNIATHVALREKLPTLFYSCEMSDEQVMQRVLVSEAKTQRELGRLSAVEVPDYFRIIDAPALSIPQLRASILRNRMQLGDIGLVVVDYLQLMTGEESNLVQRVSTLSRELKSLAREFNCPFLVLSQLSRAVEQRQDKRPMLSDLRESGAIEQDADEVIFIYRDEYYNPETTDKGLAEVNVGKNRDGATGVIKLLFEPKYTKFSDEGEKSW